VGILPVLTRKGASQGGYSPWFNPGRGPPGRVFLPVLTRKEASWVGIPPCFNPERGLLGGYFPLFYPERGLLVGYNPSLYASQYTPRWVSLPIYASLYTVCRYTSSSRVHCTVLYTLPATVSTRAGLPDVHF